MNKNIFVISNLPALQAIQTIFVLSAVLIYITSAQATERMVPYVNNKRTGDYDMIKKEHVIRFLVPYSKTYYYLDKGAAKGPDL